MPAGRLVHTRANQVTRRLTATQAQKSAKDSNGHKQSDARSGSDSKGSKAGRPPADPANSRDVKKAVQIAAEDQADAAAEAIVLSAAEVRVSTPADRAAEAAERRADRAADAAAADLEEAGAALRSAGEEVQAQLADTAAVVADSAADVAESAADAATAVVANVADTAADAANSLVDEVAVNLEEAQEVASDAQVLFSRAVEERAEEAQEVGQQAVQGALNIVSEVAGTAADVAASMQAELKSVQQQAADAANPRAQPAPRPTPPPPPPYTAKERRSEIEEAKQTILGMLASLDRGAAATQDQALRLDDLATRLELLAGPVNLSWEAKDNKGRASMAQLSGRWRLLYSSGFTSGSLGGRRPGPSFGATGPFTLGQVVQDISTTQLELNNVVQLFLRYSLASVTGVAVPTVTATLKHKLRFIDSNIVEITYTDTEVKLAGGLGGWLDSLPQFSLPSLPDALQPPRPLRSARFDVVYLDDDMRITRGDRGELRIFLKGEV